nr:MAG TPA: Transcription initiation factor IIE, alpha FINGER, Transcription [Caudoviricetes sp.]
MKILRKSKIDRFAVKETCRVCSSKFLIEYSDVKLYTGGAYYVCPICKTENTLTDKNEVKYNQYRFNCKNKKG